jgi:hypothetical protein
MLLGVVGGGSGLSGQEFWFVGFSWIMRVCIVDANDVQDHARKNEREITSTHANEPAQPGENLPFVHLAGSRDNEAQNGSGARIPCPPLGSRSWHSFLSQSSIKKLTAMFTLLCCGSDHLCALRAFDVGFCCYRRIGGS